MPHCHHAMFTIVTHYSFTPEESHVRKMSCHCFWLCFPSSSLCYCLSFAEVKSICTVTLMLGLCGGMGEEGMRKMRDSCCSQLQVHGHLSQNGAVRRGLMANFGNLSPNTSHIRKHPSPSSLYSPTQCCLHPLPFSPHFPCM